jgi:hypothetical protein
MPGVFVFERGILPSRMDSRHPEVRAEGDVFIARQRASKDDGVMGAFVYILECADRSF